MYAWEKLLQMALFSSGQKGLNQSLMLHMMQCAMDMLTILRVGNRVTHISQ